MVFKIRSATHCQIFSDRREQRRRGRQDNTRLKRGEGGFQARMSGAAFFLTGRAGRAREKLLGTGQGMQEQKCAGRGWTRRWEDGGSTRPRSHLPHKCRQFCTFLRGRALRAWQTVENGLEVEMRSMRMEESSRQQGHHDKT